MNDNEKTAVKMLDKPRVGGCGSWFCGGFLLFVAFIFLTNKRYIFFIDTPSLYLFLGTILSGWVAIFGIINPLKFIIAIFRSKFDNAENAVSVVRFFNSGVHLAILIFTLIFLHKVIRMTMGGMNDFSLLTSGIGVLFMTFFGFVVIIAALLGLCCRARGLAEFFVSDNALSETSPVTTEKRVSSNGGWLTLFCGLFFSLAGLVNLSYRHNGHYILQDIQFILGVFGALFGVWFIVFGVRQTFRLGLLAVNGKISSRVEAISIINFILCGMWILALAGLGVFILGVANILCAGMDDLLVIGSGIAVAANYSFWVLTGLLPLMILRYRTQEIYATLKN